MEEIPATDGPRRVVTGVDIEGRSTVAADGVPAACYARPGGATITEIWRVDHLPAVLGDRRSLDATRVDPVAGAGLAVRICTFPPESALDAEARRAYDASIAESYEAGGDHSGGPALHRTDTVDILTVVSGELHLVTETGEALLRQGDSVVQRGTRHAWHNRGTEPAVVAAVMIAAHPLLVATAAGSDDLSKQH